MSYHRLPAFTPPKELIGFGSGSMRASKPNDAEGDPFPQAQRCDGKEPCGECRLPVGETCDICGAVA